MSRPCDLDGQLRASSRSASDSHSPIATDVSAQDLIRDGDAAMYSAKAAGKHGVVLFDEQLQSAALHRSSLEDELRRALELREFELHYQLEVDLDTNATFGVEALIRWRRADGTLVPPDDFIPIAEQSGAIVPIGRWVRGRGVPPGRGLARGRADGQGLADVRQPLGPPARRRQHRERRRRCARAPSPARAVALPGVHRERRRARSRACPARSPISRRSV